MPPLPVAVVMEAHARALRDLLPELSGGIDGEDDWLIVNLPVDPYLMWFPLRGLLEVYRQIGHNDPYPTGTRPVSSARDVAEVARRMLEEGGDG